MIMPGSPYRELAADVLLVATVLFADLIFALMWINEYLGHGARVPVYEYNVVVRSIETIVLAVGTVLAVERFRDDIRRLTDAGGETERN